MKKFLYDHQQKIVDEDPVKCGLFLGTGSGKTRTALVLAKGTILVICPKTQKEDRNWEREYKEVLTHKLERYNSRSKFPLIKPRLTVISKEEFRRDAAHLPRFETVIVDEAHTCLGVTPNVRQRNRMPVPKASQLYEALEAYLKRTKPVRLYLCTATIAKSPMTVWGAATILGKKFDFYKFRDTYYTKLPMPGRDVWVPKRSSDVKDSLARLVRSLGYVGRLEDYFDVPEQTFITKYIELTAKQTARIKALKLEYPEPIVQVGKRHQVENGILLGDEYHDAEYFENAKIEAILNFAAEFSHLVVIAKYSLQIDEIAIAIREEFPKKDIFILEGSTTDRGELIRLANKSSDCIFIVQAQITAGWQLGKTPKHQEYFDYNCMVFASRTYSYVDYSQALGRILRADNLKKNLYINLVVKGGIDEGVDDSLSNKQDFDERIYLNV